MYIIIISACNALEIKGTACLDIAKISSFLSLLHQQLPFSPHTPTLRLWNLGGLDTRALEKATPRSKGVLFGSLSYTISLSPSASSSSSSSPPSPTPESGGIPISTPHTHNPQVSGYSSSSQPRPRNAQAHLSHPSPPPPTYTHPRPPPAVRTINQNVRRQRDSTGRPLRPTCTVTPPKPIRTPERPPAPYILSSLAEAFGSLASAPPPPSTHSPTQSALPSHVSRRSCTWNASD